MEQEIKVEHQEIPEDDILDSEKAFIYSARHTDSETFPFVCDCCDNKFSGLKAFYQHRLEHSKYGKTENPYISKKQIKARNVFIKSKFDRKLATNMLMIDIYDQCEDLFSIGKGSTDKYKCNKCGFKAKKRRHLDKHICTHFNDKIYVCTFCDKRFASVEYLRSHIKVHYLPNMIPYKCEQCPKRFHTKCGLKHHKLLHSGRKQYSCNQCQKSFYNKYTLIYHQLAHNNSRVFACHVCPRKFNYRSTLNNHLKDHFRDPLECKICHKQFINKYYLVKHERAHVEKEQYPCDMCSKVYAHMHSLRVHRETHIVGKIIYTCEVCGKTFRDKYSKKYHEEAHSGEKRYSCKGCDRTFLRRFQLNHHLKNTLTCKGYDLMKESLS